ncbi:ankyrin repeat protein [Colletotrichum tofieldiae]|uniref:Ankyrin repeat protein n=1 Tax=Colletotrichum tofieldiae TaxID=708197 RepID=A0A166ZDZ2_9PEZI|nr:ankyrin repeat protein [Colletotrichum tofieldiae]
METRFCDTIKQKPLGELVGERVEYSDDETFDFVEFRTITRQYATKLQRLITCRGLSPGPGGCWTPGFNTKLVLGFVFGQFFSHSRMNYINCKHPSNPISIDNWVRDIVVRFDKKGINIPKDYFSITGSGDWELSDFAFLTDEVGFNEADDQGHTLLHLAIMGGKSAMVQELLRHGADPSPKPTPKGYTLFHYVAVRGDEESYRQLRLHDKPISSEEVRDVNGLLPLHHAILEGQFSLVKAILAQHSENPGYVNKEQTKTGKTALCLAIEVLGYELVMFLAQCPGVDFLVNRATKETALNLMAGNLHDDNKRELDLFQHLLLLAPEDNINLQDENGETPLHLLAKCCNWGTMQHVLSMPFIQPDVRDHDGYTPLINAALWRNLDAVKALAIRRDVDPFALRRPIYVQGSKQSVVDFLVRESKMEGYYLASAAGILDWLKANFNEVVVDLR